MGGGASKATDEVKALVTTLQTENRQLKTELDEERTKSSGDLKLAREESEQLKESLSKAQNSLEGAESKLDTIDKEKGGLETESDELKRKLAELMEKLKHEEESSDSEDERAAQAAENEARFRELEAEVEGLRAREMELSTEKAELEKELHEVQQQVTDLQSIPEQQEINDLESRIAKLQQSKGQLEKAAPVADVGASLDKELEEAQIHVQELEQEQEQDTGRSIQPASALQEALERARTWVKNLESDVAAVDKAQERLAELKKTAEEKQKEVEENAELQAAKERRAELTSKTAEINDMELQLWHEKTGKSQTMEKLRKRVHELTSPPEVRVQDPCHRGVTLARLMQFFEEHCGSVDHTDGKVVCLAHKLAAQCNTWNRERRGAISRQKVPAANPNSYAAYRFCIKRIVREERVSAVEIWTPEGCRADFFVTHAWSEDFGDFFQGLYNFARGHVLAKSPGFAPQDVNALTNQVAFYLHLFSESPYRAVQAGSAMEDLSSYKVIKAASTLAVVASIGQNSVMLQRAWCDLELYMASVLGKSVFFTTRHGEFSYAVIEGQESQHAAVHLLEVCRDISMASALTRSEKDLLFLKDVIAGLDGDGGGNELVNIAVGRIFAESLLPHVARLGRTDLVREALGYRANPDAVDHRSLSALAYAVSSQGESGEMATLLLEAGADRRTIGLAGMAVGMFHTVGATRVKSMLDLKEHVKDSTELQDLYGRALEAGEKQHAVKVIQSHLADLSSKDPQTRKEALRSLGGLGALSKPHAAALSDCLSDPDQGVREAAAEAIAKLGQASDLLKDSDPQVQVAAMKMLASLGKQAGHHAGAFAKLLGDADWIVRHSALHALAHLGDAAAPYAAEVAQCLQDDQWYVRHGALLVLIKVKEAAAPHVPAIAGCLGDNQREVRVAAAEALQNIGGPAAKLCLNIVQSETTGSQRGGAVPPAAGRQSPFGAPVRARQ